MYHLFEFTIGIILILIFTYYVTKSGDNSIHNTFTLNLGLLAKVFIPAGIFLTYLFFYIQFESMNSKGTFNILDRAWLQVNEKLTKEYHNCPIFIDSLYFEWQEKILGRTYNKETKSKWYVVNYLSILIFQAWEDFITATTVDETGIYVWMNNFLQWSNSKILKNNWKVLKGNFADTTQDFGDYLFDLSMSRNPKNTTELYNLAKEAEKSDKFKAILKKRFNRLF